MKPMEQPELIPAEPEHLQEVVPNAQLRDRVFALESRGYRVTSAAVVPHGYRVTAVKCHCTVCEGGREARKRTAQADKAKPKAEQPPSSEQGRAFFRKLREQLNKAI